MLTYVTINKLLERFLAITMGINFVMLASLLTFAFIACVIYLLYAPIARNKKSRDGDCMCVQDVSAETPTVTITLSSGDEVTANVLNKESPPPLCHYVGMSGSYSIWVSTDGVLPVYYAKHYLCSSCGNKKQYCLTCAIRNVIYGKTR